MYKNIQYLAFLFNPIGGLVAVHATQNCIKMGNCYGKQKCEKDCACYQPVSGNEHGGSSGDSYGKLKVFKEVRSF